MRLSPQRVWARTGEDVMPPTTAAAAAWMWLLPLLSLAAAADVQDSNKTVLVASATNRPVILQSLFDPSIEAVVFSVPEFDIQPVAWEYISLDTPYVMNTPSFTILSQHIPPTVLDWSFLDQKVVMRTGNTFELNNLVLLNARKLGTFALDVFINSPGAVLQVHNSTFIDPVCNATTPAGDLAAAQAMPQLPQRPRNRVSAAPPLCVQLPAGRECFEQGVHMQELAAVMASASRPNRVVATTPAQAAAAATAGNFVIHFRNTTRVCRKYLDAQCLQENGGNRELCWQQAAGTAAGQGAGQGISSGGIAGAVIGGVVGLLAVVAAVLLYLRSRRRKRQHAGATKADARSSGSFLDGAAAADLSTVGGLQSPGRGSQQDVSGRGLQQAQASGTVGGVRGSFGRDGLQLGVLLGFGSYGRVFQGRWHGKDVAIKIIHCQPEQLPRVLREAEIMLQLDHPNVVQALNCVVQHKPHSKPGAAAQSGSSSTGTQSQTAQQAARQSSGGGGSSGNSSRKHTSASSVGAMLPVLKKDGSAGSSSSSKQLQAERPGGSSGGATNLSDSAAAAADQLQTGPRQHARPQQELHVVPVLATGTPASSASPDRPFQQQPQQQQDKQQQDGSSPIVEGDEGFEPQVAEVWLVLQLCSGGNLQDSFKQRNDAFNMPRLLCRLAEVAQGMAYLHSRNICHGDLKAANVLLANSIHGSFGQIAKLTDFGFAGVLREGVTHHSTQNLGTISHCAPEVLQSGRMSPAADVYAFAILMWELLTASTAFKGVHTGTIIQQVVLGAARPPLPPDAPEDYALLMEACWAANPADRPSFDQVLQCLTIMLASLDPETANTNHSNAIEDVLQQRTADAPPDPDPIGAAAGTAAADGDGVVGTGGAAAAPAAAASVAGSGGTIGLVQQQQQQQQRPLGSYQVGSFDMSRAPSSGAVAAGGMVLQGCGLPGSAGSAGSAASAGSSRLSELRPPQQSHHIQDL